MGRWALGYSALHLAPRVHASVPRGKGRPCRDLGQEKRDSPAPAPSRCSCSSSSFSGCFHSFSLCLSFLFILNSDSFRTVYAQESRPETRREPRLEHAISLHDPRYTGSSPLRRGRTLLHAAGHRGFLECLKALINARGDPVGASDSERARELASSLSSSHISSSLNAKKREMSHLVGACSSLSAFSISILGLWLQQLRSLSERKTTMASVDTFWFLETRPAVEATTENVGSIWRHQIAQLTIERRLVFPAPLW